MKRALFLDRDGVINEEVGYLHRSEDVRWVEGIFSLARTARELGWLLVVVTNQSGIARGYYTEQAFQELMAWMRESFAAEGAGLDAVYFCPYHPREGIGVYRQEHPDRKPGPGMLVRAARDLGLELGASVMVGDRCSDVAAAHAAGLRKAFLLAGTEPGGCDGDAVQIATLGELEAWLRKDAVSGGDEPAV